MNSLNIDFNKRLALFSLLVYALYWGAKQMYPSFFENAYGGNLLVFFALSSSIGFFVLEKAINKNPKEFVLFYLAVFTIKFLAILIIIVAYFKAFKGLNIGFASTLLTTFLVFTAFELPFFLKLFKK